MSILAELSKAEAQKSPHYWASVFAAHCWIGVGLWSIVAMVANPWHAVWIVGLLYFFIWEVSQLYIARKSFSHKLLADSVLDTTAVVFGCVAAVRLSEGVLAPAVLAWAVSLAVVVVGWWMRE